MHFLAVRAVATIAVWAGVGTACTGMRPVLDQAGPAVATTLRPKSPVLYLGEGCYVADRRVVSCSIDSLPAGEITCTTEPSHQFVLLELAYLRYLGGNSPEWYYDSNLDSFQALLNTHRCHDRYYDALAAAPVSITIRDARKPVSRHFVPLDELGPLPIPSELAVSPRSAREICSSARDRETFVAPVCVDATGAVTVDTDLLRRGYTDVPDRQCNHAYCWLRDDFDAALRGARTTPSATKRCALVEIDAPAISCSVAPGRIVSTTRPIPHS